MEHEIVPVSLLLLILLALLRPIATTCPRGFYVEGVRTSGETNCLEDVPGANSRDDSSAPTRSRLVLPTRIYCTGGTRPIVVDGRSVGCQRR